MFVAGLDSLKAFLSCFPIYPSSSVVLRTLRFPHLRYSASVLQVWILMKYDIMKTFVMKSIR